MLAHFFDNALPYLAFFFQSSFFLGKILFIFIKFFYVTAEILL